MCKTKPRQKWPNQTHSHVNMRSQEDPECGSVGEKFIANADQALFKTPTSASPPTMETARESLLELWPQLERVRGYEETWNHVEEEPRSVYMESKTHWSSHCSQASLDLDRVEGCQRIPSNATYLLSSCLPLSILISFWFWNYTTYWSDSIQSNGTLCYNYLPVTVWSSGCPLQLPTSGKVSPHQEHPPWLHSPSMPFSRLSRPL